MSWFTELRDQAEKGLGIDTPENVARTAGNVVRGTLIGSAPGAPVTSKRPVSVQPASDEGSAQDIKPMPWPFVVAALAAVFYFFRGRGGRK